MRLRAALSVVNSSVVWVAPSASATSNTYSNSSSDIDVASIFVA